MRYATLVLSIAAVLLLLACGGKGAEAPPLEYTNYLTDEMPPCTPLEGQSEDPCSPDQDSVAEFSGDYGAQPLAMGVVLNQTPLSAVHLVARATYLPDTVRCAADKGNFRLPTWHEAEWSHRRVKCFADLRVGAYVLGSGPPTLTVITGTYGYASPIAAEANRVHWEQNLRNGQLSTSERIYFIGPSADVQTEAWEIKLSWAVERRDDGTVIAVHHERDGRREMDPADYQSFLAVLEMELPAFSTAVTTAHQARVAAHGGRIGLGDSYPMLRTDANRLKDYYTEIGAYGHANGPPVVPPPACGRSMTEYNSDLMQDCTALLTGEDTLWGTATLNWEVGTVLSSWDGITTAGTPTRVTKLLLSNKSLSGTIPYGLGAMSELTHLDLSGNSLTGEIPSDLGQLDNLTEVRLSGNSLTGCIPSGLKDVTTNDLASLNLLYCPAAPETLRGGVSTETTMPLTWAAATGATKYRVEYRTAWHKDWAVNNDITTAAHTVSGLLCKTHYEFRVSAYGDGTARAATWGPPSEILYRTTAACTPPAASAEEYTFTVMEDASLGTHVGTVQATDGNGGTVTYEHRFWDMDTSISLINVVDVNEQTGALTVAADLSDLAGKEAGLVVYAQDERGGETEIYVLIKVGKSCTSGTAVPASEPGRECP